MFAFRTAAIKKNGSNAKKDARIQKGMGHGHVPVVHFGIKRKRTSKMFTFTKRKVHSKLGEKNRQAYK